MGAKKWAALIASFLGLGGCAGEIGPPEDGTPPRNSSGGTDGASIAGGAGGGSGAGVCTSGATWTDGNRESPEMNPGMACIHCHSSDDGPDLAIAGTLYATAHEPDLCKGANGTNGARVLITGANGRAIELVPNRAGNFFLEQAVALPYRAKVVYMGREREMVTPQSSGDCNGCHTETGANAAPGRIMLP